MRRLGVAVLMGLYVTFVPTTHADVGGEVPSPGLCDYPFIGHSEMIGAGPAANVYLYVCDGPTEINGSHWHAELSGESVQAAVTAGVSLMFINANVAATGNLGALGGSTSWRCPDNSLSATAPNPPSAWKNAIQPKACEPAGPPLPAPGQVLSDSGDVHDLDTLTPAVTNPDNPNPDATVNPRH